MPGFRYFGYTRPHDVIVKIEPELYRSAMVEMPQLETHLGYQSVMVEIPQPDNPLGCQSAIAERPQQTEVPIGSTQLAKRLSYRELINMAILSSPDKRLLTKEIFAFIEHNYPEYAVSQNGKQVWKKSIRATLTMNKHYEKEQITVDGVPYSADYWRMKSQ